jgi:hypothetical protein
LHNLSLIIPAKNEEISLPIFSQELFSYNSEKIVISTKEAKKTIKSIKNFKCKIVYPKKG